MKNTNILIILAGGSGSRYMSKTPKQYSMINGKELLEYSIDEMKQAKNVDRIIVVLNNDPNAIKRVSETYGIEIIEGGKERAYSFQNALDYINQKYPECRKVVFHEAARPLVSHKVIDLYFNFLDKYDYVESCKKINDSLGSYVIQSPRREDYYLIQAPEAYRLSILNQYYNCDSKTYFAANQFPSFIKGFQYFDIPNNIKLTTPNDKILIECMLSEQGSNTYDDLA